MDRPPIFGYESIEYQDTSYIGTGFWQLMQLDVIVSHSQPE